jgi:GNAT superfamily N-acetyltransferase
LKTQDHPVSFALGRSRFRISHYQSIRGNHMDQEYHIVLDEKPEESAWGIIGRGISAFNRQQAGDDDFQRLCFVLCAPDQEIMGGVLGEVYWEWLHIDLLWVSDDLRGRGHGGRLLMQIEEEARQRGAKQVYLDTFSFQAPAFYERHGYQVFGALEDFPPGHQRYFMTKQL